MDIEKEGEGKGEHAAVFEQDSKRNLPADEKVVAAASPAEEGAISSPSLRSSPQYKQLYDYKFTEQGRCNFFFPRRDRKSEKQLHFKITYYIIQCADENRRRDVWRGVQSYGRQDWTSMSKLL